MEVEEFESAPGELDRCRAWADRNGKYLWYWPDIAPAAWRRQLEELEQVVRDMLIRGTATLRRTADVRTLSLAAFTSGVGPLLGYWIEQGAVEADADSAALLALHLDQNRQRMDALAAEARRVVAALQSAGVGVTVLKGMDLAFSCYPDPGTRPVSDIDLMVEAGVAQARAAAVLAQSGFVMRSRNFKETTWVPPDAGEVRSLLLVHAADPYTIDLHDTLSQHRPRGNTPTLDHHFRDFRAPGYLHHPDAATLTQPVLLLYLASHIGIILRVNTSLVRLVDIVLVIRRDSAANRLDWDAFIDLGRRTKLLGLSVAGLTLAERLVPGTIPASVLAAAEKEAPHAVRRLLRDLAPADAQQLDHMSVREHYIWARGVTGVVNQLWADLLPPDVSSGTFLARYRRLARRAWKRGFSR